MYVCILSCIYCTEAFIVFNKLYDEIPSAHLKQGYNLARCMTN